MNRTIKIYGCHLMYKPSLRVKLKFKFRDVNEYILNTISTT